MLRTSKWKKNIQLVAIRRGCLKKVRHTILARHFFQRLLNKSKELRFHCDVCGNHSILEIFISICVEGRNEITPRDVALR